VLESVKLEDAQSMLTDLVNPLPGEHVPLLRACGRVASRDVFADYDLPSIPQAAVDGYALPSGEAGGDNRNYVVKEHLRPGEMPGFPLEQGSVTRVITGGPVPDGTGAVIPYEATRFVKDNVTFMKRISPGSNLKLPGEDFCSGDLLVRSGSLLTPGLIGVLAAYGRKKVDVFRRPRVAVLSLGQEIVPYHTKPFPGQVRDSNGPLLSALVQRAGGLVTGVDIAAAGDSPRSNSRLLESFLEQSDLVLTVGGAASGFFDRALYIIRQAGARLLFRGIKIKPGSHSGGAVSNGKLIISLSGNPAACAVGYHLLVAPVLRIMQGLNAYIPVFPAVCAGFFKKNGGKRRFLQGVAAYGREGGWTVKILPGQKSSMLRSLIDANALVELPPGRRPLVEGDEVKMLLLNALGDV
jgi:molybdopterin molybdotransferase